ncbi:MAG TPA: lactonase family protein [Gemmatimonadaceae bacterium]|nr:lactonase family protein [Gemmatimonadaceae bacterium]
MTDRFDPSRRDFLAVSALGLVGFASRARGLQVDAAMPDSELLYVGTYTDNTKSEGIYLVRMTSSSGELRVIGTVKAGANPSFLAIHPNGRALYAVNEVQERSGKAAGGVSAFAIAADTGSLSRINEQSSEGAAPCYVSIDRRGRAVLVANYVGGTVALLPIQGVGALAAAKHVAQHRGTGPNKERQEAPHAHCVVPDPSNVYALAADLGIDRVLVYHMDLDAGALHEVGGAHLRPGAGPRHLTFHPSLPLVFVANELDSTVTSLRFDAKSGALSALQTISTLPAGWAGTNYPADIHFASSGRTLYVSNRGHNSIAVFSAAPGTGELALAQTIPTGGDWPRNFSLDPTGKWLLVANQRSGNIVVFSRDSATGTLATTAQRLAIPSPVCLRFRAHAGTTT